MGLRGKAMDSLGTIAAGGIVAGMTDAQLLERYGSGRDEGAIAAFSILVERHGPMVLRVCRARLHDEHAAEDAFQAVFLVLVRKAGTLRVRDSLGPWLHGVAVRTSADARARDRRRAAREARGAGRSSESCGACRDGDKGERIALIHEQIAGLPGRYREALILCDLQGLSHEQAAARLGCPVGTIKSRQARGRAKLRTRLEDRGVTSADLSVALGTTLPEIPPSLIRATVVTTCQPVMSVGATAGTASGPIVLAWDVSRKMALHRWGLYLIATLAGGLWIAATAFSTGRPLGRAGDHPPALRGRNGPPAPVVPSGLRPPAGSVFAMRIVADSRRDREVSEAAGYRWFRIDLRDGEPRDGLVTRTGEGGKLEVAVRPDPQNITERDLLDIRKLDRAAGTRAIAFTLTHEGARRLGTLTRTHLPEEGGAYRYRIALIVEGVVVWMPMILGELRDAVIIEFGGRAGPQPAEIDRIVGRLAASAAYNIPPNRARAVGNPAEAVREANLVDLAAIGEADTILLERTGRDARDYLKDPRTLAQFRRALKPGEIPREGGELKATLSFLRGPELIRKVWVREGGEWGFERPGTSWTTGLNKELWRLIEDRMPH